MFSSEQWLANSGADFYNGVATQSLRFNDGSSSYLARTFLTPTNQNRWTINVWLKRSNLGTVQRIIGTGPYVNTSEFNFFFQANNTLKLSHYTGGGVTLVHEVITTQVFRDTSSWYNIHHIFDSAGSGDDRQQLWVNGVRITSFSGTSVFSSGSSAFNTARVHEIGRGNGQHYFDGYMSEINVVDGLALDPSYFGETKNGVWIAKTPVVSDYGNNGFRLQFANTGENTTGEGTSNSPTTNIGDDSSGSGHNFSVSGIDDFDCVLDSPENNFATYNPLQIATPSSSFFLSEGNLALTATNNSGYRNCSATFSPMGFKGYIEFVASALNHKIGIIADTTYPTNQDYGNSGPQHVTLEYNGEVKFPNNGTSFRSASDHNLGTLATGDVMGMAFDFTGTNRNVWFHRANTYGTASGGLGNPATGANPIVTATQLNSTGPYRFHFGINNGPVLRINFGQDGTFGGTETAQGNKDGNGIGDFYYAPPSGYLALCTANLPEPTIGANSDTIASDHFSSVLFTGGSGDVNVAVPFKPDWVWMKARSHAQNHSVGDSSRGGEKFLSTSTTTAESDVNELHFTDDGFTSNTDWHTNNYTYVAWNWKANGGTTTTNDASSSGVGSLDSVIQANQTAGFSIVTYTGTGSNGSIKHGLSVKPSMYVVKRRDDTDNYSWATYNATIGATKQLRLNATNAEITTANIWNNTEPTSTVFSVGANTDCNADGGTYVAYCFHSVEGYSKMGSFIGNGNVNGTFVALNFRPSWIMFKTTTIVSHWTIVDNARSTYNVVDDSLYTDTNASEATTITDVDFLSNGFKWRGVLANETNVSGQVYIYMAFAEAPFKYANAR